MPGLVLVNCDGFVPSIETYAIFRYLYMSPEKHLYDLFGIFVIVF